MPSSPPPHGSSSSSSPSSPPSSPLDHQQRQNCPATATTIILVTITRLSSGSCRTWRCLIKPQHPKGWRSYYLPVSQVSEPKLTQKGLPKVTASRRRRQELNLNCRISDPKSSALHIIQGAGGLCQKEREKGRGERALALLGSSSDGGRPSTQPSSELPATLSPAGAWQSCPSLPSGWALPELQKGSGQKEPLQLEKLNASSVSIPTEANCTIPPSVFSFPSWL